MSAATSSEITVGVRELKNQLSGYLDRVKAGEEITVTEHGRPIARLTSVSVECGPPGGADRGWDRAPGIGCTSTAAVPAGQARLG